ncbi:MAG: 4'-phosphopantetheinyl transferase superfamily protein [Pseudomonadota bacterium]
MDHCFHNQINIHALPAKPGIFIWYSNIPIIINSFFTSGTYHNLRPMVNEIFKKNDFAISCFSPAEIKTINSFKALKKQLEWMAGRYLIKQMIHTFFLTDIPLEQITLSYQDHGAPFITSHPDIPISLSHSHEYTAAACSIHPGQTLGIDIEKIDKKPGPGFLKTAFTQAEIMNMEDDAAQIFKHWTIKEAYLKYIKQGFNESLHKVEVINNQVFHHQKKTSVDIFSTVINSEYALSLISNSP